MRVGIVVVASATLGFGGPVMAEEIPTPKVDYAAQVRMEGMEAPAIHRHRNGVLRMEMNMEGEKTVFLFDTRKGTGVMLMGDGEDDRVAMEVGAAGGPVPVPKTGAIDARRTGRDRVAGHACDVWTYTDPTTQSTDTSCVTGDGVLLRAASSEGGVAKTMLEVISLDLKAQDPALFSIPPGYQKVSLPGMRKP